jgi:hypothetical protein
MPPVLGLLDARASTCRSSLSYDSHEAACCGISSVSPRCPELVQNATDGDEEGMLSRPRLPVRTPSLPSTAADHREKLFAVANVSTVVLVCLPIKKGLE